MCAFRWFFIMLASRLAVPRSGNEEVGKRYLKPSSPGKNLCCLNVKQILQINQNMHVTLGCNCTVCPLTSFIRRHALQKCACMHSWLWSANFIPCLLLLSLSFSLVRPLALINTWHAQRQCLILKNCLD